MSNNQFNLHYETELNEGLRVTTLSTVFCSGDNQAHKFIVKVMRNGKHVSLSGATVSGSFVRPDNVTITLDGTANADGDAVVTLKDSCYAKQGRVQITIRATIDGVTSTLFLGIGGMLITSTDSFVDDGNIVSLDDLLDQIAAMEEATARANEAADRADPDAIVQMVLEELGASVIGTVESDKTITLDGDLAADTYTLKYVSADGTKTGVCTLEVVSTGDNGGEDSGGDDTGTEDSGEIPLNIQTGKIDTSTGTISASENYTYSDMIPIESGKTYTLTCTNCTLATKVCYYDANEAFMSVSTEEPVKVGGTGMLGSGSGVLPMIDGASYFRLRFYNNYYNNGYADSIAANIAGTTLTWTLA